MTVAAGRNKQQVESPVGSRMIVRRECGKGKVVFATVQRTGWLRQRSASLIISPMYDLNLLLDNLHDFADLPVELQYQAMAQLQSLAEAGDEEIRELVARFSTAGVPASAEPFLKEMLAQLIHRQPRVGRGIDADTRDSLVELYGHLRGLDDAKAGVLQWLAVSREADDLALFAELIATDPPAGNESVARVFGPLFQRDLDDAAAMFPQLLAGLQHAHLAAAILDFCGFLTRNGIMKPHPASEHAPQLVMLLGEVVNELEQLEETGGGDRAASEVAQRVNEGVALAVSLCDSLALIGDESAIGKLYQAMRPAHRRLRTEAAAALAKLGEGAGEDALLELAAEPVSRLRVLAYADELDLLDRIDPRWQTAEARAESELTIWLAQPTAMGIPPDACELVERRSLFWPGYDDLVECFLFRFAWEWGEQSYSNIGIAGPMVHSITADLCDLPPDDIFALFAGWQAEHEEIYETDVNHLSELQLVEVSKLERRVRDAGCGNVQPLTFGSFFGERVLIAAASREGVAGTAIADGLDVMWHAAGATSRPIGPAEAYCIYKGRRLLRTFND